MPSLRPAGPDAAAPTAPGPATAARLPMILGLVPGLLYGSCRRKDAATRNVVLYTLMSLDGAVEDPIRYFADFDKEMETNLAEMIGTQDTVLLGRKMYEEWSRFWPSSDLQPFADFINNVRKYVLSSSTPTTTWPATTFTTGPVADLVADLKGQSGRDIGVHGSIDLARSMLREGLIDELRLEVAPSLSGIGRRLFDADLFDDTDVRRLELLQSKPTSSGSVLLHYRLAP